MIRRYRDLAKIAMLGTLVIETAVLIRIASMLRDQNHNVDTLERVSQYYVDILEKNEVPLTDYDVIALNLILSLDEEKK